MDRIQASALRGLSQCCEREISGHQGGKRDQSNRRHVRDDEPVEVVVHGACDELSERPVVAAVRTLQ
ncbi:MAG: hypothetical protein ACRDT1_13215, partial [Micromonosporaceae bacterium]